MTGLVVRRAERADLTQIATVWSAAWRDGHVGHVPQELVAERADDYFTSAADLRRESTWVALGDNGAIAGVVIISGSELLQLAVDRAARRSGVGTALLSTAEREIFSGHHLAWLAVVAGNITARTFYARHGW